MNAARPNPRIPDKLDTNVGSYRHVQLCPARREGSADVT